MIDYTVPAMEAELSEIRDTFETNFVAVVHICQTFLPLLMKAKGTIVQIGSVAGVGVLGDKLWEATCADTGPGCSLRFRVRIQRLKGCGALV